MCTLWGTNAGLFIAKLWCTSLNVRLKVEVESNVYMFWNSDLKVLTKMFLSKLEMLCSQK